MKHLLTSCALIINLSYCSIKCAFDDSSWKLADPALPHLIRPTIFGDTSSVIKWEWRCIRDDTDICFTDKRQVEFTRPEVLIAPNALETGCKYHFNFSMETYDNSKSECWTELYVPDLEENSCPIEV